MNCPECGALDFGCEARFNEFLALEFSDTGYAAVHHLTVATYMLQHSSKLTKKGWMHMRELLREFLMENKNPAFIRSRSSDFINSSKRKFKITSKNGMPVINKTAWQKTILDVHADDAGIYCKDVTTWAGIVLKDTEDLSVS